MLNFSPTLGTNSSRLGTTSDRSLSMSSTGKLGRDSYLSTFNLTQVKFLGLHTPLIKSAKFLSSYPNQSEIGWDNWNPLDKSNTSDNFDQISTYSISRQQVAKINDSENIISSNLDSDLNLAPTIFTPERRIDNRSTVIESETIVETLPKPVRSKSKQKSKSKAKSIQPDLIKLDRQKSSDILPSPSPQILPAAIQLPDQQPSLEQIKQNESESESESQLNSDIIEPNLLPISSNILTTAPEIVEPPSTSILVDRIDTTTESPRNVERTNISPISAQLDGDIPTELNLPSVNLQSEIVEPPSTSILVDRIDTTTESPRNVERTNISPISAQLDGDIPTELNLPSVNLQSQIVEPPSTSILVDRADTTTESPRNVERTNISPISAQLDGDIPTERNLPSVNLQSEIVEPPSTSILVDRADTTTESPRNVERTNISPISAQLDGDIPTELNLPSVNLQSQIVEPPSTSILVDRADTTIESPRNVDRTNISPISAQLDGDIPTELNLPSVNLQSQILDQIDKTTESRRNLAPVERANISPISAQLDGDIPTELNLPSVNLQSQIVEPPSTSILVDQIDTTTESPDQLPPNIEPVNQLRIEPESPSKLNSENHPSIQSILNDSSTSILTTQSTQIESESTKISNNLDEIITEAIQTNLPLKTATENKIQSEDLSLDPERDKTEIEDLISVQGYATGGSVKESEPTMQIMRDRLDLKSIAASDTVAAMLTPGEFVINAKDAQKNINLLTHINSGGAPKISTPKIESDAQTDVAQTANLIQRKNYDPFTSTASSRSIDSHQISFLHKSPLEPVQTSQTEHHQSPPNYSSPSLIFRQPHQHSQSASTRIDRSPDRWDSIEELINGDNYSSNSSNLDDRSSAYELNNYQQIESRASPTISPQFITPVRGFATGGEVTPSDISTEISPTTHTIESPISNNQQQPENNDPAELEILAREIYHRLRQRLEIERERHGSYSGNLPW